MEKQLPIECGDGWRSLIEACDRELRELDPHYEPVQIKEKFGGLRYYFHPSESKTSIWREMLLVTTKYEALSMEICEACGQPGSTMKGRGWIVTRCEEHAK